MSTENIVKFSEAAASNPELAAKIQAITAEAANTVAGEMARLSAEAGTPFTAEEFLAQAASADTALSDEALESVSGGIWEPNAKNIAVSIVTLGIFCFGGSAHSFRTTGDSDKCQISNW